MITKSISTFVVDQILNQTTPSMNYENCLNKRQKKNKCTQCMDICPAKTIKTVNKETKDWSTCTNCNLCVAHCPTRAISLSQTQIQSFLDILNDPQDTLVISCLKHKSKTILNKHCIGSLPWEYIACLALRKKITFVTLQCSSCEHLCHVEKTIERLRYFFKNDFDEHFIFSQKDNFHQERSVSRRQLFKKANQTSALTLSSLLSNSSSNNELKFTYLLNHLMMETNQTHGWIIPIIDQSCIGCAVCERLCPRQAIKIKKEDKTFSVIFYPTLCNHCGQCEKSCIHHCIQGYGIASISSLKPVLLLESEES